MLPTSAQIVISKLDAAQRQLDAAVRLIFSDEDPLAVHTLVGAASIVLFDLLNGSGQRDAWENKIAATTDTSIGEVLRLMRLPQNFLKHADSDPEATLIFNSRDTEQLLFLCTHSIGTPQHFILPIRLVPDKTHYQSNHRKECP